MKTLACLMVLLVGGVTVSAQVLADKKALPLATAKKMAEAAEKFAIQNKWNVVISIVDEGGNLVYLERMDGSPMGSIGVSQEKAVSSVKFSAPTKNFEDAVAKGANNMLRLGVMPFEGGLPIIVGGKTLGAVGVSGATAAQDGQVAKAAIDFLMAALK
jgi:glc operon protein GlcG